jgi:type 1 glutamine amidotransferase
MNIDRRTLLATGSLTLGSWLMLNRFGLAQQPAGGLTLETLNGKKILYFTKSAGFEHDVVKRQGDSPAFSERLMTSFAKKYGFEVHITKDGGIFDNDYKNFDCFFFYTTGDLTSTDVKNIDREPAMSAQGKENLLKAIADGKGFVGSHCASDTFHTKGNQWENQAEPDPYIKMIGGEFSGHGKQQLSKMKTIDPNFPGLGSVGDFTLNEEWYSLRNFAPDMHVILLQETQGMSDFDYERPPYPATWARQHEKGRVFYTSMGHREDVWTNPIFESILIGGLAWASGAIEAKIPANITEVAPEASVLPKKS